MIDMLQKRCNRVCRFSRWGDLDGQGGEFAVDASVTPARVLAGEPKDEKLNPANGGWSARSFRAGCLGVVAAAEEVAVPAQDSVGGDDEVELAQLGSGDAV